MKIPRCRYWRCPECRALYEKKDLADALRRQREGEELSFPGKYRCAKCGAVARAADVFAGEFDVPSREWATLPGPAELTSKHEEPEEIEELEEEIEEARLAEPDADEEDDYKRRKHRHLVRYRGLKQVNTGLLVHYIGMLTFLASILVGWLGFVILVGGVVTSGAAEDPEAAFAKPKAASDFLFICSWVLSAISSLSDLLCSAFCLGVTHALARKFLIASMAVRLLGLSLSSLLLAFSLPGLADMITLFLAIMGWLLWVGFLWGLADLLNYPIIGDEAVRVTWSALYLVITWVLVTAFALFYLILTLLLARIGGFFPCFAPMAVAGTIAGIIKYLLASGKFETVWTLVLYPTGIPLIMRYLDLIGTTRMIILRRS